MREVRRDFKVYEFMSLKGKGKGCEGEVRGVMTGIVPITVSPNDHNSSVTWCNRLTGPQCGNGIPSRAATKDG